MARYFVLTYVVFLFAGDGVAADLPVLNGRKVPADGSIIGVLTTRHQHTQRQGL